jgi:hypothetical protein
VESMMLVEAITVVRGGISISQRGFYAVPKLIFIHPSTNFYATSVQITFFTHIDYCFYASNRPSHAMIQNLKFMNFIFFKKIFIMDLELCTKMSGVQ